MEEAFLRAGSDGELATSADIWKKGIVFMNRRAAIEPGYRVTAGFKRRASEARPLDCFRELYRRVESIGNRRVAELVSENPSLAEDGTIVCHSWRLIGKGGKLVTPGEGGGIVTAFVTLALQSVAESARAGELRPSDEDLQAPGGTSVEDLARAAPQRAEEIYNEFDFSDSLGPDPITVSYGERIPMVEGNVIDFGPTIERAEAFASSYHDLLASFGEVTGPFRIVHREWFLADPGLPTVHVCFSR